MSQANSLPPNFIPFQVNKKDEFDIKGILFKYFRQWPWILLGIMVGLFVAYYTNKSTNPTYIVNSSIVIKDEEQSLGADIFGPSGFRNFQTRYKLENELGILKSHALAEETLSQLNFNTIYLKEERWKNSQQYGDVPIVVKADWSKPQLTGGLFKMRVLDASSFELSVVENIFSLFNPLDPFYKTTVGSENKTPEGIYSFGEAITGQHFNFTVSNLFASNGDEVLFYFKDTPSLATSYIDLLQVNSSSNFSSVVNLSLETPVRRMGQDYLNTLMNTYLNRELREKNEVAKSTIFFINEQLRGISDSLSYFEDELEQFRTENKVFNLSEEGAQIFMKLQDLEKQQSEIGVNLQYYQTLKTYIEEDRVDGLIAPSIAGEGDPLLNALVVGLSELQAEKIRLSANYSLETPVIREVENKIQSTKEAIGENVRSAIGNLENYLAELSNKISIVESEVFKLPETEKVMLGLQRKFSINENIYIYLLEKKAESEITLASNKPNNKILDKAMAASAPIAPKSIINLIIGLLIGFFIPVLIITIRDFLYQKVKNPKELEKALVVPLVGMIGRHKEKDSLSVLNHLRSTVSESFRSLRADIPYLSNNKNKLTLLFTSTISGEGKTFISINMASVYSLMGKKTILIGLDLRKPKIADDFGLKNDQGISTCLSRGGAWKEVVKPSGYENLDVILSGPIPPNPAELLLQENFSTLIKEIQETYDVVILDCPPVGLVSETKELMKYADINFFVFRQKYSALANIQFCNDLSTKGGIHKIYAVLNDVHGTHGYGYQYGYYTSDVSVYGYHDIQDKPWWKKIGRR